MLLRPDLSASPTGWHACSSGYLYATRRLAAYRSLRSAYHAPLPSISCLLAATHTLPSPRLRRPATHAPSTKRQPSHCRLLVRPSRGAHVYVPRQAPATPPQSTPSAFRRLPRCHPAPDQLLPHDNYSPFALYSFPTYSLPTIDSLLPTPAMKCLL